MRRRLIIFFVLLFSYLDSVRGLSCFNTSSNTFEDIPQGDWCEISMDITNFCSTSKCDASNVTDVNRHLTAGSRSDIQNFSNKQRCTVHEYNSGSLKFFGCFCQEDRCNDDLHKFKKDIEKMKCKGCQNNQLIDNASIKDDNLIRKIANFIYNTLCSTPDACKIEIAPSTRATSTQSIRDATNSSPLDPSNSGHASHMIKVDTDRYNTANGYNFWPEDELIGHSNLLEASHPHDSNNEKFGLLMIASLILVGHILFVILEVVSYFYGVNEEAQSSATERSANTQRVEKEALPKGTSGEEQDVALSTKISTAPDATPSQIPTKTGSTPSIPTTGPKEVESKPPEPSKAPIEPKPLDPPKGPKEAESKPSDAPKVPNEVESKKSDPGKKSETEKKLDNKMPEKKLDKNSELEKKSQLEKKSDINEKEKPTENQLKVEKIDDKRKDSDLKPKKEQEVKAAPMGSAPQLTPVKDQKK